MKHQITRLPISAKDGISIFVFADLQEGSAGFDEEAWLQFLDHLEATPNAYAIGLGDYQDFLRPSMRTRLQASISGDTSAAQMLENMIVQDQDRFIKKYFTRLKGKLLGLHSGHHEYELLNGSNTSMRLASAMGCPYLGWSASTRLVLEAGGKGKGKGHNYAYTIVSTHGNGGGRNATGDIRALNEMVNSFVCDQVIRGHSCKAVSFMPVRRYVIRRQGPAGYETQIPRAMNVGGFCRSYTDGWKSSYAERAGYMPQPLTYGVIRIRISQRRDNDNKFGNKPKRPATYLEVENVNLGESMRAETNAGG